MYLKQILSGMLIYIKDEELDNTEVEYKKADIGIAKSRNMHLLLLFVYPYYSHKK